ncbi:MAG: hypothetical protein ACYC6M_02465 [Terriglobales bacterium]
MNRFLIDYRNSQGTLMRILTAVSRRGMDFQEVTALAQGDRHQVRLVLETHPKQIAQLCRDWRATVDVLEVRQEA